MYKYQGFENDLFFNSKPMERLEGWSDMRKSGTLVLLWVLVQMSSRILFSLLTPLGVQVS